jgi:protein-tyrosine kinase
MSRIHEALKKAELERATQSTATATAVPFDPPAAIAETNGKSVIAPATATDVLIQPDTNPVTSDGPLRFEDLQSRCAIATWQPNPNSNVFANPEQSEDAAEQFRTLRSRLYQLRSSRQVRVILITSPVPGDGKTFVTHNLAQAFVRQPDRRALIIDGDLRASRLHVPLGASRTPGLSDYLRGDIDEMTALQRGQESDLFLIAGGSEVTNPSELLSNGRLKMLIDRLAPAFDWVIIDSPPCVPVADANLIADICDGILLVVRAGSTPSESARKASQELQGKRVIGVVLNTVERNVFAYSSYYGSAYDGREIGKNKIS